jgi:predicted enzyme related to lactoylglutathione lyase
VHLARTSGAPPFGAIVGSAGKNGTSPHWEFDFAVSDLDAALARVCELGGDVHRGPHATPSGKPFAGCHDPQRAAFGLVDAPTSS